MHGLVDSIVDDITPEEAEDEGAGGNEVEDGDLDPANVEREAENLHAGKVYQI